MRIIEPHIQHQKNNEMPLATRFLRSAPPLMVSYCVALHLCWATLLFLDYNAYGATPVAALLSIFKLPNAIPWVLIWVATLAWIALFIKMPFNVVLLIPQQVMLLISACGSATAIFMGAYADGVERPIAFVAADQIHMLLAAVAHALAILSYGLSHD